jgi:Protein of unknown function (DUF3298)
MADKKARVEIPQDVAADVLFLSDRTCCVCRKRGRPVQLHHVDDDSSNSVADNLAVLCFDCHRETQIRGGFDRKLDAAQVRVYKADWVKRVAEQRGCDLVSTRPESTNGTHVLRYLQMREKRDDFLYDFEADYALVGSDDSKADSETNLCISYFVSNSLQRFRKESIASAGFKREQKQGQFSATAWDSLAISHNVSLYTRDVLSLEFQIWSYGAGAAHPNSHTKTMNFRLRPSLELQLQDIFKPGDYLKVLSQLCISDLHRQQPLRWGNPTERALQLLDGRDEWILRGAGPFPQNYQRLSFRKNGIVIHFDPYWVGSYAEGKYEVFVPAHEVRPILEEEIVALLDWN